MSTPNHASQLQGLGAEFYKSYWRTGAIVDLDTAIQQFQESLELTPDDHPERAHWLQDLGTGYRKRYLQKRIEADLDIAIQLYQESLELTPDDHPDRARRLQDLGLGYCDRHRYIRKGTEADLDTAIQLYQESLELTPDNHPDRAYRLQNLGVGYRSRYIQKGIEADLDTAIRQFQESLELTPDDHPDRAHRLQDLGAGYHDRYLRKRTKADLEIAIQAYQESLELTPDNHPDRIARLQNLGVAYRSTYLRKGTEADLDTAIQQSHESLELTPDDHPERARRLQYLGVRYHDRYLQKGIEADLDTSIQLCQESLELTPDDYPERARWLQDLGARYHDRYLRKGTEADLDTAIQQYQEFLNHYSSQTLDRLRCGIRLTRLYTERKTWSLAYQTISTIVPLIARLIPRSSETSVKQKLLAEVVGLGSDAAAIALMAEKSPYEAIRLLELGRGVIIASLNEMRADISDLQQKHPQLAEEYIYFQSQLNAPAALTRQVDNLHVPAVFAPLADRRGNTGQKLEQIIKEIQRLPGFDRFLVAPSENELKAAAATGPVVIINVSDYRCDALVVEEHGFQVIRLPRLYISEVRAQATTLSNPDMLDTSLLEWLWDTIAKPVLDTLGLAQTPSNSWPRIWWIPTGPLTKFPIHAAGYRGSFNTVLDRVISSYSASIRALIDSRQRRSGAKVALEAGKAVLVGMERTPGQKDLRYVPQEIEKLSRLCGSMQLDVTRPPARRSDVISALQDCRIFHFAGHGLTDHDDPSKSSLLLTDGLLPVASLFEINLHNRAPFLAYLSACGTGEVKHDNLIDEALHLISACQLAGFRHVIGTLWKVKDQTCVEAATKTYEWMIGGNMSDDSVAEGLHRASRHLRAQWASESESRAAARASDMVGINEDGHPMTEHARSSQGTARDPRTAELYEDPPLYWVPYVHFGI